MTVDLTSPTATDSVLYDRRTRFAERYNMYHDDYRNLIVRRLTEIYAKAGLLKMDKQIDFTNNVYKTIVNKISRVYTFGVQREFTDEKMEELYLKSRIDKYMKQANRYVNAFNDVLLQVAWNDVDDQFRLIFRYPHKTRVEVDEYGNPSEVEYYVDSNETDEEKWAYYSNTEHYYKIYNKTGDEFKKEPVEGNEEMINPYGMLPFVFLQNGFRDVGFFDEFTGADLTEVTLDMAVYNTFKNYMIKWQSFKQIVVQGSNIASISGQILDPATALSADGEDVKIDVLDLQANLKELQEVIDTQMTNVAINYNIAPSQFRMTGAVSSGFALQMENTSLDEYTEEQQSDFVNYEEKLYELLVIVGNVNGAGLSESADFNVVFNPIEYSESSETVLNAQEKAITLGLTNAVSIIEQEKKITTEEAEEEYAKNIYYRNQSNENLNAPTLTTDLTAEAMGVVPEEPVVPEL